MLLRVGVVDQEPRVDPAAAGLEPVPRVPSSDPPPPRDHPPPVRIAPEQFAWKSPPRRAAATPRPYGAGLVESGCGTLAESTDYGRMNGVKTRKDQKPLRQTTLDEFTGGDLLVGVNAPGATVKPDPQQGDLFRSETRQLRFEMSDLPDARPRQAPEM